MRTWNTCTPSSVSIAIKSLDFSFNGRWTNPMVASNTDRNFASLSFKLTSSKVFELKTDLTIYLLRLVGSKQILRSPLDFLTTTKEFSHSVAWLWSSIEMIPCFFILWISCSNLSFRDRGTCLAGFCIGTASSDNWYIHWFYRESTNIWKDWFKPGPMYKGFFVE